MKDQNNIRGRYARVDGSAPAPYPETFSDRQALEKLAADHGGVQRLSRYAVLGAKVLEIMAMLDPSDSQYHERPEITRKRISDAARSLGLLEEKGGR